MRTWNLTTDDVHRWRLAADARLPGVDYADDQIWEIVPNRGDPAALGVETTYGLRALSMRIFPTLIVNGLQVIDPASFAQPPSVQTILPNYMLLIAQPVAGLQLRAEYWVHDSHALLGRFTLSNRSQESLAIDLRLSALLRVGQSGSPFSGIQIDGVYVLAGELDRIEPVLFLEGGAKTPASAYPSLGVKTVLESGKSRAWSWVHAAESDQRASFQRARLLCNLPWEPNIARIKLLNSDLLEISTGEPDWDAAFWLTQVAALQAFTGPTRRNIYPGMLGRRSPRDGYSASGDGMDYDGAWGGIDTSQAYFQARQILYVAPDLIQGEILNRIKAIDARGVLDGRPGPGGQRAGWESMPLLADLAWHTYNQVRDKALLQRTYPVLIAAARRWFGKSLDYDQDGHPEWEFPPQTGFDAWPAFVAWERWGQGLELRMAERPDLAAYLFAECAALERMADELGEIKDGEWLRSVRAGLQGSLEQGWSEKAGLYLTLDRDLNQPTPGERLGREKGSFKLEIKRTFEVPVRVLIRTFGEEANTRELKVMIQGKGRTRRKMVEEFTNRRYQWFWKMGCATAEKMATELDWIRIDGLDDSFSSEVWLADTTREDITGLLPVWSGMILQQRAERLIEGALLDRKRFWRAHGVPTVSARDSAYRPQKEGNPGGVWMFANSLLGEGLLRYGYRDRAAELIQKMMPAVIDRLRREGEFGTYYHPDESISLGDEYAFEGLAPLDLFLESLGLQLINPSKVCVEPGNPYPWPIAIRWRGLTIEYQDEQVILGFPDGTTVRVAGEGRQWVEQE